MYDGACRTDNDSGSRRCRGGVKLLCFPLPYYSDDDAGAADEDTCEEAEDAEDECDGRQRRGGRRRVPYGLIVARVSGGAVGCSGVAVFV